MWVFEERGKLEYPEKNLSEQGREPTTNSTHIWCQPWDLNLGSDRFSCLKKVPLLSGASPSRPWKGVYPQSSFPSPPPNTTTSGIFSLPVKSVYNKMFTCFITKIALFSYFLFFIDQQNGIPLPVTPKKPWSIDANLMHIRCGDLTLAPISTYKFSKLNLSIFLIEQYICLMTSFYYNYQNASVCSFLVQIRAIVF